MPIVPAHYGSKLPKGVNPPESYEDAVEFFGWAPEYQIGETAYPGWEAQMTPVRLPQPLHYAGAQVLTVRVHPKIREWARLAFEDVHAAGLWYLLDPYAGSYAFRLQRGGETLSAHAFGAAFDFDQVGNPHRLKVAFDAGRQLPICMSLDTKQRIARFARDPRGPECVRRFEEYGFFWGGRFLSRPDPMHYQWCTGW